MLFTDNENVSQEISFAFSSVILSGVYFLLYIVVSVCKDTKSRAQYKETRFLFLPRRCRHARKKQQPTVRSAAVALRLCACFAPSKYACFAPLLRLFFFENSLFYAAKQLILRAPPGVCLSRYERLFRFRGSAALRHVPRLASADSAAAQPRARRPAAPSTCCRSSQSSTQA